jgi:4,5-DOPA dioxygenase extradiol
LMMMFPEADIPVVCISLHSSLDAGINMQIGKALQPLRDDGVLILGSGYTFHNMQAFFHPSSNSYKVSGEFNEWLKNSIMSGGDILSRLLEWEKAPGARFAHPREEHLIPLLITAAAGGINATPQVIFETEVSNCDHIVSGYLFE